MSDGLIRCWETDDLAYQRYHDEEWGRPIRDERGLYERFCLEGFQSGLSWLTILRKREGFRAAFEGFAPDRVAEFGERDVERLLQDASIVRHRGKIEATIANARATVALRETTPLQEIVWAHEPANHDPSVWHASTPESIALSKALRKAGFRFVGPTTAWAAMQACGIVNDHRPDCWVREAVEAERGTPS
jgi:DNA-3-methyladenine glycosylase I